MIKRLIAISFLVTPMVTYAQGNMNQSAKGAGSSQNMGALLNAAAGAAFSSICPTKGGSWACPLAALSFMQAGQHAGQSSGSYKSYQASLLKNGTTTGGKEGKANSGLSRMPEVEAGLQRLAEMGYVPNPDGSVTTPNGTIPPGGASSPSDLAALYGSEKANEILDQIKAIESDVTAKYNVIPVGTESGGGGGSDVGGRAPGQEKITIAGFPGLPKPDPKRSLAGMKKNIGNEAIGVSADNIFTMIQRRYESLRKNPNEFY